MMNQNYLRCLWILLLAGIIWRYSLLAPLALDRGQWLFEELARVGIAIGLFWFFSRLTREQLLTWSRPLMLAMLGVLAFMLLGGGHEVNRAVRWIQIGSQSLQPAEFAKAVMVIYLAGFIARHRDHLSSFRRGVAPAVVLLGTAFFLIVRQPDFGSALLLFAVGLWMLMVGGASLKHLGVLVAAAVPAGLWLVIAEPYRIRRILAWLAPGQDLLGAGYQVNQAKWAISEGGLWGKGLLEGAVRHGYLPESTNDFTAAVWIEEFGLLGLALLLALWLGVLIPLFLRSRRAGPAFDRLLAAGIGVLVGGQILFNLGVVTGLLPNKGLPLPLLSSGGSSLMATGVLLGLGWGLLRRAPVAKGANEEVSVKSLTPVWNGL